MFILKTKGTAKIPDYIQIRDNNFTLIDHFRADKPERFLKEKKLSISKDKFIDFLNNLEYWKLKKLDI